MLIQAKIKTKQSKNTIEKMDDGTYTISVKVLPMKNKANMEVIKILSKHFNLPKSQIIIQSGKTSHIKKIILGEK